MKLHFVVDLAAFTRCMRCSSDFFFITYINVFPCLCVLLCPIISANVSGSRTEIEIPCQAPKPPIINITWRYNHSQIILTKSEAESYKASDIWEKHLKKVLETGLTLKDLSSNQEGKYMCEISNTEETYISNIFLQIKEGKRDQTSLS